MYSPLNKLKVLIVPMLLSVILCDGCTKKSTYGNDLGNSSETSLYQWKAIADSSTDFLINNFWNNSPGYFNANNLNQKFNYWPQSFGLDILIDAYYRTKDSKYLNYINEWFNGVHLKNGNTFIGYYYDDMGWNALSLLNAYDVNKEEKFKDAVDSLWENIKTGWNGNEGGGICWNKGETAYKNTPANGPACILAARLYQESHDQNNLDWAKKIYNWWTDSLYNAKNGYVYDGINRENNGLRDGWAFTYNQGLMIGASLELYNITKDSTYLNNAERVADNMLSSSSFITQDELLKDEGGGDGGLFKGIFVHFFTQLILSPDLPDNTRKYYITFLKLNAETLWSSGTNKGAGLYGTYWNTPPSNTTDLTTEESGCLLMDAMAMLKNKGLL